MMVNDCALASGLRQKLLPHANLQDQRASLPARHPNHNHNSNNSDDQHSIDSPCHSYELSLNQRFFIGINNLKLSAALCTLLALAYVTLLGVPWLEIKTSASFVVTFYLFTVVEGQQISSPGPY